MFCARFFVVLTVYKLFSIIKKQNIFEFVVWWKRRFVANLLQMYSNFSGILKGVFAKLQL